MKKKDFLKFLDDEEIRSKIISICSNNNFSVNNQKNITEKENIKEKLSLENKNLRSEISILENEKRELKKDIVKIKEELSFSNETVNDLKKENDELRRRISLFDNKLRKLNEEKKLIKDENVELKKKLNFYDKNFGELVKIYGMFSSLDRKNKNALSNIFKNTSYYSFLINGVNETNFYNFRDFLKDRIMENNNSGIKELIEIYNFFLNVFLSTSEFYKKQNVKKGENFDPLKHIKTSNSKASGKIKEIILYGWENIDGEVIKQSIVKI